MIPDIFQDGDNVVRHVLKCVDHVFRQLLHVRVSITHARRQIADGRLQGGDRAGDRPLRFLGGGAGNVHLRLDHVDRVDNIGVVADVIVDAGQLFRLIQQPLHFLFRAAKPQLQVVQHGVVLLSKALIGVLDALDVAAHLVGVVRHVRDGHVYQLHGFLGVAAQTAHQRSGEACRRLHVVVGAQARRLVGGFRVLYQLFGAALEQRLHAADQLLIVGIAVHDLHRSAGSNSQTGLRRMGNARRGVSHFLGALRHLVRRGADLFHGHARLPRSLRQVVQIALRLNDLPPEALELGAVLVHARVLQLLLGVFQLLQLVFGVAHSLGQQFLLLLQQLRVAGVELQQPLDVPQLSLRVVDLTVDALQRLVQTRHVAADFDGNALHPAVVCHAPTSLLGEKCVDIGLCGLVGVLVLVVGLLRVKVVDHAHGHPRQSLVRQPQLGAPQHKLRPVGLPGCLSHFFAGVLVVFWLAPHNSRITGSTS